ncbi:uncharacterized protein K441DRAFT_668307 [Cenococcum geophilum 1.58]|uniref:uncharacterized protein n=1 Tax=Cenococcum geophilum 1.58 TaxID=794803 RepID=UPI00358E443C|nr:hypothetical protein K441DRAFT_668307 [Cenococcum geophilum 1.58]
MTDGTNTPTTHWAVLVGINYYVKDRCLKGSVRDAETVKQYLEAGSTHVDIAILTATTPSEPGSTRPPEKAELWPTRTNVVSSLNRVLAKAKPGDFVYIHYSGHGTRRNELANMHKDPGNLALVLFEDNEYGSSYLRGIELASCLRKMVEQGLLVALVLDCCYSGSVLRDGDQRDTIIRSTDYDPAIDAASTRILGTNFLNSDGSLRNSQIPLDQWLVDPDGYTILSACSPHEKAWEIETGGARRGALTYFLIDALSALRKAGVEITHQALYQNLRSRFHASWPQQTPMRYGNENLSFFGKLVAATKAAFASVYRTDDGRLCLTAGEAHGIYEGDEYAVYPFEQSENATGQKKYESVMVKVDTVRCLTSDLVEIESSLGTIKVETGWKAKPVTYFSPKKIPIRLMANVNNPNQWIQAARQHHFLNISTGNAGTESYVFGVTVNENEEYEILGGTNEKIISLPTLPLEMNGASSAVMHVLQHLATFKFFEGVENRMPSPSFEGSFSLLPATSLGESGVFEVRHGEIWGFTVENLSTIPLYLAIFNFTPSWQIVNLISLAGGGDFFVLLPKIEDNLRSRQEINMRMEVPEFFQNRGESRCEDVVKVFITSKATSFPAMILPEMPLSAKDLGGEFRDGHSHMWEFLSEFISGIRGKGAAVHEQWTTRNFIIRTDVEKRK